MKYRSYLEYKNSGIEWIGDVPRHWLVTTCRAIVQEKTEKNEGSECVDYLSVMANIGVIPYADKGDVGNKKPEDLSKCKVVTRGDFIINSMNYGIGSYGVSQYDGICSPVYIVLKPKEDIVEPGFAFRIFESRPFQIFAQSFGNGILAHRCAINWDILKSLGVVVPPKPEQQAILTFLDRETSRIDRLIIEQRTLIERLKEKRIAIICRAVTKGLNLSAPMKQSGVNWLGVVPVSWTLTKLKKVAEFVGGGTPDTTKSEFWDGGIPWVSSKDMKSEIIRDTEDTISQLGLESSASRIVRPGSVLMVVRSGILRHTIPVAINEVPVSINQDIRAITFNNEMDPRFFMRLVQGLQEELLFAWRKQGATVESLEQDYVSNTIVPVPPIDTQVEIVGYLERVMSDLDQLVAEAESGIELLLEHRSALISAVVTGKVDVRTSMAGTA